MKIEHRIALGPPEIDLAALADEHDLLDVAVAHVDSPIGDLLLAATPRGLLRLSFFGEDETLAEIAVRVSPRILEAPAKLDGVRRQLDEYFDGERDRFDVAVDWALVGEWGRKVLAATAAIPFGETRTYGDVAAAAGNAKASRAAGTALGHNPVPVVVPCHRVVPAGRGGTIGNYTGGVHIKEHLLRLEGVIGL